MRKVLYIMLIGLVTSPMTLTSCGGGEANGQDSTMVNVIDRADSVAMADSLDLPGTPGPDTVDVKVAE